MTYDFAIVGGGIIGLATGRALLRQSPQARLLVLEKENDWASHQTGHNSGVIHSGIYYRPGSLKARFAVEGGRAMVAFCSEHGLPHDVCGKVIVATRDNELAQLDALCRRGAENGIAVRRIGPEELREIEPHVGGRGAVHVPSAGIVDYRQVARTLAAQLQEQGADMLLNAQVEKVSSRKDGVTIETGRDAYHARLLINCAGLYSDRIARLSGAAVDVRIVPFRGEYYTLKPERTALVKNLVYPVPNPDFPFLGVHFTRMVSGEVHAGPNAVLSLKREGYHKCDVQAEDLAEVLVYPGFWKLATRHWREGLKEMARSFSKQAFVRSLQRLVPEIQGEDLIASASGVRAQALMRDGRLVDDFWIVTGQNSVHVCNAPSPAATASLEIGKYVAARAAEYLAG